MDCDPLGPWPAIISLHPEDRFVLVLIQPCIYEPLASKLRILKEVDGGSAPNHN